MGSGAAVDLRTSPPSPSPSSRRHHHHHHHHHNSRHHHRHQEQPCTRRQHNHSQDSGRSSDSSVSHSRTSLESTGYRLLDSPHRHQQRTIAQQQIISSQSSSRQPGGSLDIRSHKSGTLEGVKNQKLLASVDSQPIGLSLSTSTPLFKKKTFTEPQRESRVGNLDLDKSKNGRESSRSSYGPEPSTSPYRETVMECRGFRQEMPPYRPTEIQPCYGHKPQSDKYGSLIETGSRYRDRERETLHRERVNSFDKSNTSAFYPSSAISRNISKPDNTGSIARRHHGCSASLSEANVREMYGSISTDRNEPSKSLIRGATVTGNILKPRNLEVSDRERDYRRNAACNNSLDSSVQQPLARSYSFVQQQKQQQKQQLKLQQQQQQQSRRHEKDDDSMHERYLVGQSHDQSRQRLCSNTSSSNSSHSSINSAVEDEVEGQLDADNGKKKRSNGNPSPPPSPYYGNLLVDADHLLPLQHYILQQAKLSGTNYSVTFILV